jgi:hypothetical protein
VGARDPEPPTSCPEGDKDDAVLAELRLVIDVFDPVPDDLAATGRAALGDLAPISRRRETASDGADLPYPDWLF